MANKNEDAPKTAPQTKPQTDNDAADQPVAPGMPSKKVIEETPVNVREDTEKKAEAAIETIKDRNYTPSVEKGADRDFNTWLRAAHENGNPEQLSPMQAEQNIRDKAQDNPVANNLHDLSHEDTRWVVQNVLGEQLPAEAV